MDLLKLIDEQELSGALAAVLSNVPDPAGSRVATLATIPGREDELRLCMNSLKAQVDALVVVLNYGDTPPPAWLAADGADCRKVIAVRSDNRLGDGMKFCASAFLRGYQLTCDDDLVYPADYVRHMVDRLDGFGRRCAVGVGGSIISGKLTNYYSERRCVGHALHEVRSDIPVNITTTGALAFHSSLLRVPLSEFRCANMADVFFGMYCQRLGIPLVCVAHPATWLRYPGSMLGKPTIWCRREFHTRVQAEYANEIPEWRINKIED